jgi:uncharacterized protein with HEPN domain
MVLEVIGWLAREYVENTVKPDLLNDRCTQQAVVLNLITIGEAASRTMNGLTVTEQDSSPRRASFGPESFDRW